MIRRVLSHGVAMAVLAIACEASAGAADVPTAQAKPDVAKLAQMFGTLERVSDISLSPDGKHAVVVAPGPGVETYAIVIDTDTRAAHLAGRQDGKPMHLKTCGWASNTRIVCHQHGVAFDNDPPIPYTRTVAFDSDGKNALYIGVRTSVSSERLSQYDGRVIDWLGGDGNILMTRDHVPEYDRGTYSGRAPDGLGVDRVDTLTGKGDTVEKPDANVNGYFSDGQGNVRLKAVNSADDRGILNGGTTYYYRPAGENRWKIFSKTGEGDAFTPIAVDGGRDLAYATKRLNGRDAIYSVSLDGNFKSELVASSTQVDVDDIITIGRHGRVIGASYATDRLQTDYFDPEYKKLAAMLGKAIPSTPLIHFLSASADEQRLIVFAGSDTDPGHYYVYDKTTHHLNELVEIRPELADLPMAPMKSVSFTAKDGTTIPAYLTLPASGESRNLPVIVMPHGGPDYRDEWGFDWLVQFFAQRGFAVLQPEYRGSGGYGENFAGKNAFQNWQLAMSDICDAGHWLVKEGLADPAKLAIVGWSYGGYAALQANVVDSSLFKAIIAIAPVTDLGMLKSESQGYTNSQLVAKQIGSGDIVTQGSPARHADRIQAPVLIFHGDHDTNVGVAESRAMDAALRRAGKQSTLVVFPGLDHQLEDGSARGKMLEQADSFLRASLKM